MLRLPSSDGLVLPFTLARRFEAAPCELLSGHTRRGDRHRQAARPRVGPRNGLTPSTGTVGEPWNPFGADGTGPGRLALWGQPRLCDARTMISRILEPRTAESRATVFSAMGDPTRVRILDAVADGELCVCDLQEVVDVAPNLLSYHLKVLRDAGLIEGTRRGRWIDYATTPQAAGLIAAALPKGLQR